MWSFSIKFGELRHKNVNKTFIIKRKFTSKGSQPHTRLANLDFMKCNKNVHDLLVHGHGAGRAQFTILNSFVESDDVVNISVSWNL